MFYTGCVMTDDELKRLLTQQAQETRAHFDGAVEQSRRHSDVTTEALRQEIRLVAEAVTGIDRRIEREIGRLDEKVERGFAETQAMFKFSHAELDRRVSSLEERQEVLERSIQDLQARIDRLESTTH
jgi:uncharacterized protein YukE